jgi:hypothetical protein
LGDIPANWGVDLSTVPAGMQKNRKNREKAPSIIEKTTAR